MHRARTFPGSAILAVALTLLTTSAYGEQYTVAVGKGLTGFMAFVGVPETNGIRLAADQLNEENYLGEGRSIELKIYDSAGERGQMFVLVNRAAALDDALVFFGPANSGVAMAVAPLTNELELPMIAPAIATEPLDFGPWYMKITTSPERSILPIAKYAVEVLKVERPAAIFCRDNEGHIANTRTFRDYLAANGIDMITEKSVLTDDTDFSAVATGIAAAEPDAIYVGANAIQAANIVTQLREAGVSPKVSIFGSSGLGLDYLKHGGPAVENTYLSTDYNIQDQSPMNLAFIQRYRERYGIMPDNWAAVGYSEMLIVARAIKEALPNPTRAKVLDAIMSLKDAPVLIGEGKWTLGEDRIPDYDPPVVMIKDGAFVTAPWESAQAAND